MKLFCIIRIHDSLKDPAEESTNEFVLGNLTLNLNKKGFEVSSFKKYKEITNIKDVEKLKNFLTVREFIYKHCKLKPKKSNFKNLLNTLKYYTGSVQIWIHKRSKLELYQLG
jgi:hypothetical protein